MTERAFIAAVRAWRVELERRAPTAAHRLLVQLGLIDGPLGQARTKVAGAETKVAARRRRRARRRFYDPTPDADLRPVAPLKMPDLDHLRPPSPTGVEAGHESGTGPVEPRETARRRIRRMAGHLKRPVVVDRDGSASAANPGSERRLPGEASDPAESVNTTIGRTTPTRPAGRSALSRPPSAAHHVNAAAPEAARRHGWGIGFDSRCGLRSGGASRSTPTSIAATRDSSSSTGGADVDRLSLIRARAEARRA